MNIFLALFILFFLHVLADYPLQGDFLGTMKGKDDYILFCHVVIWTNFVCIGLFIIDKYVLWKFIMLFVGHFIIDRWKARGHYKKLNLSDETAFHIDQALHFVQLIICLV